MSFDSPQKNQAFAEAEGFQYELWTDDDKDLALYYGAASSASQSYADRITVVLGHDGNLLLDYRSVSVSAHPGQVLSDCRQLFE